MGVFEWSGAVEGRWARAEQGPISPFARAVARRRDEITQSGRPSSLALGGQASHPAVPHPRSLERRPLGMSDAQQQKSARRRGYRRSSIELKSPGLFPSRRLLGLERLQRLGFQLGRR